jgi:hypothetical protein
MRWFQVWSTAVNPLMCARSPLAAASFSASASELAAKNRSPCRGLFAAVAGLVGKKKGERRDGD